MVSLLMSVDFLKEFGVFSVIMPFIFILAITYGILTKTEVFGEDKVLNSVIAFVVAFISLQMMPVLIFIQLIY